VRGELDYFLFDLFGFDLTRSGILSQERWKEVEECVDLGVLLGGCLCSLPWNPLQSVLLSLLVFVFFTEISEM
jgi:hypothetical protein